MPNGNNLDANPPVAHQDDAATTPIDLAQAFKMLNQVNREAAEEPVADPGAGEGSGIPQDGNAEPGENGRTEPVETDGDGPAPIADESGDGAGDDGLADGVNAIDFNAYKQELLRNIQQNAASQVRKEFNEQDIGYYSAAELTVRDEQTGQIRFRNPDVQDERDPNYYFKSRTEMQNFINSWNQGVDFEFRKAVNEKQQELLQLEAPKARLFDFMPKWQAMDDATKQVFDDLLTGHEIRDASGQEIGFNVDLNAVAAQAEKIAKRFQQPATQAQQAGMQANASMRAPASSGPALDMQTGNGKSEDEKEPTNIGEALKMFDKQNRKGK